jgi:hypothetical protein
MSKKEISVAFVRQLQMSFHAFANAERASSLSVHQVAADRRSRKQVGKPSSPRAKPLTSA